MKLRALSWAVLLILGAPRAWTAPPGREISLSRQEVKDTFFAYVLGIIRAGVEVDIDSAAMREILIEFASPLDVPFDLISRVTQRGVDHRRTIGLEFSRPVSIPIPFALLFYHPGSIVADQTLSFSVDEVPGEPPSFVLSLSEGNILVNIDDWLEVLLRAYVEDTWIRHLVFFVYRGDWIGLLEGNGRRTGREIRAYFNFTRNSIVFPLPAPLDAAGRALIP